MLRIFGRWCSPNALQKHMTPLQVYSRILNEIWGDVEVRISVFDTPQKKTSLLPSLLADPELKTLPRSKRRAAQRPAVRGCCSEPGPEELLVTISSFLRTSD